MEILDNTSKSSFFVVNDLNLLEHPVRRIFFISSQQKESRGDHAHIKCWQTLVCLGGKITVTVNDGIHKEKLNLKFTEAVTIPPMIWSCQDYEIGSNLMVLCSHKFDEEDYIRDYKLFLKKAKEK